MILHETSKANIVLLQYLWFLRLKKYDYFLIIYNNLTDQQRFLVQIYIQLKQDAYILSIKRQRK